MNRISNNLTIMKKLSATLAALAIAVSALAVDIGKPAPDFTVTDINGLRPSSWLISPPQIGLEPEYSDCPFRADNVDHATGAAQELQADLAAKGVVWLLVGFGQREKRQPSMLAKHRPARNGRPTKSRPRPGWMTRQARSGICMT